MAASRDSNSSHRMRRPADRNGTFGSFYKRPPITYGKRVAPLPLRGTHFRRDPYEIPSDSDEEAARCRTNSASAKQPRSDDPPLSEDELEAVYGRNASPIEDALTFSEKLEKTVRMSDARSTSKPSQRWGKPKKRRRLPVNELVLITSPLRDEERAFPKKSEATVRMNKATSAMEQSQQGEKEDGMPLTSIRKRLKTPKFTHKSVAALRKRKHTSFEIGDGFEGSELDIRQRVKAKSSRKTNDPLVKKLISLDLRAGPLPDVKFDGFVAGLELGIEGKYEGLSEEERPVVETTESGTVSDPGSRQDNSRRIGFSDRVLDEMVMQQLSSISAPRRAYSISSDHSSDEQDEFEETDDENESGDEPSPVTPARAPAPTNNDGVTLDFRKAATRTPGYVPTPFGKRKLMEVDDTIYDEPERPHVLPDVEDEMLDEDSGTPLREPTPVQPHRPRSILRNHAPRHYHESSDTRPEHTAANTRRNSMILLDNDEGGSRYFATAMDMLQRPVQDNPTKPRVLKHRSSQLRRAVYDVPAEIQVLDSESRVLETSPGRPDYSNATNLDVLRRSSDAVWTSSQSLPKAPRDLKTLTRTVSRGYGTMSQAIRRRPSLPFQSPTKVQRRHWDDSRAFAF